MQISVKLTITIKKLGKSIDGNQNSSLQFEITHSTTKKFEN